MWRLIKFAKILLLLHQEQYYLTLQYNIVMENISSKLLSSAHDILFHTYLNDNNVTMS